MLHHSPPVGSYDIEGNNSQIEKNILLMRPINVKDHPPFNSEVKRFEEV